jgi:hypothetical protein
MGSKCLDCEGNAMLSLAMNFCDYHVCKQVYIMCSIFMMPSVGNV